MEKESGGEPLLEQITSLVELLKDKDTITWSKFFSNDYFMPLIQLTKRFSLDWEDTHANVLPLVIEIGNSPVIEQASKALEILNNKLGLVQMGNLTDQLDGMIEGILQNLQNPIRDDEIKLKEAAQHLRSRYKSR